MTLPWDDRMSSLVGLVHRMRIVTERSLCGEKPVRTLVIRIEHQTANLGVRSSNLFGRANKTRAILQFRPTQKSHWVGHGQVFASADRIGRLTTADRRFRLVTGLSSPGVRPLRVRLHERGARSLQVGRHGHGSCPRVSKIFDSDHVTALCRKNTSDKFVRGHRQRTHIVGDTAVPISARSWRCWVLCDDVRRQLVFDESDAVA
jgi:hypothetical protein